MSRSLKGGLFKAALLLSLAAAALAVPAFVRYRLASPA